MAFRVFWLRHNAIFRRTKRKASQKSTHKNFIFFLNFILCFSRYKAIRNELRSAVRMEEKCVEWMCLVCLFSLSLLKPYMHACCWCAKYKCNKKIVYKYNRVSEWERETDWLFYLRGKKELLGWKHVSSNWPFFFFFVRCHTHTHTQNAIVMMMMMTLEEIRSIFKIDINQKAKPQKVTLLFVVVVCSWSEIPFSLRFGFYLFAYFHSYP